MAQEQIAQSKFDIQELESLGPAITMAKRDELWAKIRAAKMKGGEIFKELSPSGRIMMIYQRDVNGKDHLIESVELKTEQQVQTEREQTNLERQKTQAQIGLIGEQAEATKRLGEQRARPALKFIKTKSGPMFDQKETITIMDASGKVVGTIDPTVAKAIGVVTEESGEPSLDINVQAIDGFPKPSQKDLETIRKDKGLKNKYEIQFGPGSYNRAVLGQ
jgi:hypothetical protein